MSNADYTTPDMGQKYRSSKFIYDKIMEIEKKEGLNGHLMLIHLGPDDRRTDKFYNGYLDKMIKTLKRKGYTFVPVLEAIRKLRVHTIIIKRLVKGYHAKVFKVIFNRFVFSRLFPTPKGKSFKPKLPCLRRSGAFFCHFYNMMKKILMDR